MNSWQFRLLGLFVLILASCSSEDSSGGTNSDQSGSETIAVANSDRDAEVVPISSVTPPGTKLQIGDTAYFPAGSGVVAMTVDEIAEVDPGDVGFESAPNSELYFFTYTVQNVSGSRLGLTDLKPLSLLEETTANNGVSLGPASAVGIFDLPGCEFGTYEGADFEHGESYVNCTVYQVVDGDVSTSVLAGATWSDVEYNSQVIWVP